MRSKVLLAIGVLVCVMIGYNVVVIATALREGSSLAARSEPFERSNASADRRLLVIGDSTAVGTGASSSKWSLAGRLASDFPSIAIENRAKDGAVTAEVEKQLQASEDQHYDAVLIQTGGNDVLRLTSINVFEKQARSLLQLATQHSDHVFVMSVGDIGTSPSVPWPLSPLFSSRSKTIAARFKAVVHQHSAVFVDFTAAAKSFESDPTKYYATDGLHPSDEGYRAWYSELLDQTNIEQSLKKDPRQALANTKCVPQQHNREHPHHEPD